MATIVSRVSSDPQTAVVPPWERPWFYPRLLRLVDYEARRTFVLYGGSIPFEDLQDAGLTGLTGALARATNPETFNRYAETSIRGGIRSYPDQRKVAWQRQRSWWQEVHWSEPLIDTTAARLAWLEREVQAHTACFPPALLTLYRAIRDGSAVGVALAQHYAISPPALQQRYMSLITLIQHHLLHRTTTCAQQHALNQRGQVQRQVQAQIPTVKRLTARGLSQAAIARQLGLDRRTVRRIQRALPSGAGGQPVAGIVYEGVCVMKRQHALSWLLLACALAGSTGVPVVLASSVQGSAVTISGLDDLSATVDQQARRGAGKIIAMVLGMGGLATVLSGRIGLGLAGVAAGMGMGFVPNMMSSAFDAAPAATGVLTQPGVADAWWTPFTASLYPGLVLLKWAQDPVLWLGITCAICVLHRLRHHSTH